VTTNEQMSNAPVYYALAQAQFNPISAMAKYIVEIQDALRRVGYTLFETQEIPQLTFVGGPSAAPSVATLTTWRLTKADQTSGFVVNPSSLVFHTTHYQTHQQFLDALLQGIEAVNTVVSLEHLSRLGLRYLNAVLPDGSETVDQYLAKGLHGVQFGANQRYASMEAVFDTETAPLISEGTLVTRVHRLTGLVGFPSDMVPAGLLVREKFVRTNPTLHAVIDMDHFVRGTMPVSSDSIRAQAQSLHAGVRRAFEAIASTHAKAVWA
jgi:uncharacterized protein (TIGR04255 family)